jgi:hypothetical protein
LEIALHVYATEILAEVWNFGGDLEELCIFS